jgi:AcrR family transcriptional regulator
MPRIQAETIAEHVARQEQAVFDAAIALFVEQGFAEVTLADIAARVGLARSSLYRYFPDKAHILLRWFRQELPEQVQASREVLSAGGSPAERLGRWAEAQLDYARRPEHALVAALADVLPHVDDDARAELASSHRQLAEPLAGPLAEAGLRGAELATAVDLLMGLVVVVAGREASPGAGPASRRALRAHLHRVIGARVAAP